jgi:hypothetical protein
MNEQRARKCLRQVEHIWGHLWHKYSVTVNQVMVKPVKCLEMISIFVNFPFICSNIPAVPAYRVYISQLIQYSRACGSYHDFHDRGLLLTRKLLNQGFLLENWNHLFCRKVSFLTVPLSISRCRSRYEADLSVSVVSFIWSSIEWQVLVVEEVSTRREPQTMGKQLVNFITCGWTNLALFGERTSSVYRNVKLKDLYLTD